MARRPEVLGAMAGVLALCGAAHAQVSVVSPTATGDRRAGQPVPIVAEVEGSHAPGPIHLTAAVTDPAGVEEVVRLRDDGRGLDERAGDGVWTGLYRAGEQAGAYRARVKALRGDQVMWSPSVTFPLAPPLRAPAPWRVMLPWAGASLVLGLVMGVAVRRRGSRYAGAPAVAPPAEAAETAADTPTATAVAPQTEEALGSLRAECDRLRAEVEHLRARPEPAPPGPEEGDLRAQLAAREAALAEARREYERLDRERQQSLAAEGEHVLGRLFDDVAGPLSQLEAARARVEAGGVMEAADVVRLLGPLRRSVEQRGLRPIGAVGEQVTFDPAHHQALGEQQFQEGAAVVIRFPGFRHQERLVRKALVAAEEA